MTSIMPSPLLAAATSTFESLALLLPDEEPTDEQRAAPLAWGVQVAFHGPLGDALGPAHAGATRGTLTVGATDDVARTVAANMLGLDAADDARLVQDALGELANVVCGNLLPELAGRAAVFHLDAPRAAAPAEPPAGSAAAPALALTLGVDAGRVEVALHVGPAADPIVDRAATPAAATTPPPLP